MEDQQFELTRRKALAGLTTLGVASAGAGFGTSAMFTDEEAFEDNSFTAGTLNLVVDYFTSLDQGSAGSDSQSGEVDGGGATQYTYEVSDLKPGDSGTLAFCPKIVDNPGYLWIGSDDGVTDYENGRTEPERQVDMSGGGSAGTPNDGAGAGELSDAIEVTVSYAESVSYGATNDEITCTDTRELNNPADYSLADLSKDLRSGFQLDGNEPNDGDTTTDAYPASSGSDDQQGPCLCIEWTVPETVGNEIQSDAFELSFLFAAVQERNNASPDNPFVDLTVGQASGYDYNSIQTAVDNASSGDVIGVASGTYQETLNIQGRSDISIVSAAGATIEPASTIPWGSETNFSGRTTSIRIVNSSGITFQNLTFDFEQIDDTVISGMLFWESEALVCESTIRGMSHANDAVDLTSYLGTNDPGSSAYSDGDRARVEFRNNEFVETGRIGINAEDFVNAVVENNEFETTDAGYAVEIGSEATGIVRNNVIHGYNTDFGSGAESAGIYVENAYPASGVSLVKDVVVSDNEVYDCTVGVRIGNEYDTITGDVSIEAVLARNHVYANEDHGISITDSGAEDGSSVSVTGHNNAVENNGNGYYIFENNANSEPDDGNITVDVEREAISDNDVGMLVESASSSPVSSFQSIALTDSNIENNANDGVRNDVAALTLDATDNWWNATDGPDGAGPGSGDSVSSNVDFTPFESAPVADAGN